jgi:hypothetical protein
MKIDDVLARLPPPGSHRRLDSLEEGVWRAVDRRLRRLRAAGATLHLILLVCIVSGAYLFARSYWDEAQEQRVLLGELSQDVPFASR